MTAKRPLQFDKFKVERSVTGERKNIKEPPETAETAGRLEWLEDHHRVAWRGAMSGPVDFEGEQKLEGKAQEWHFFAHPVLGYRWPKKWVK
jgi:hypothetical protein